VKRRISSHRRANLRSARNDNGPLMPVFLVFAACAFASGFALRLADPIILPVAAHFQITPAVAAMLNTAYALPYALAQPFLGPIGDRFGKPRCIQVCVAGLAVMLLLGAFAPSFALLMATRMGAGVFAGGLIPLVIAGIGDSFDMSERQVMIGRMLFAIISGRCSARWSRASPTTPSAGTARSSSAPASARSRRRSPGCACRPARARRRAATAARSRRSTAASSPTRRRPG
jgi:hypothetical protein